MSVAPHEGREVHLVLSGFKPLATIERDKDCTNYAIACALMGTGMLVGRVQPSKDCLRGEVAIVKPCNRHLLNLYEELLKSGVKDYGIKEYHRKMGRLFGYTEQDIDDFINAEINCECTKCKGK